jgi:membrane associated rhomboid family serine protease
MTSLLHTRRPSRSATRRPGSSLALGLPVVGLLAIMWLSEFVDQTTPLDLDYYGIRPRTLGGLLGIPLAPLLHGSFAHLVANAGAFLILGLAIAYTTRRFWTVTIAVTLIGGLAVWLLGDPGTVTIGASGVVYGYGAFLVAWGLFTRRLLAVVVAVAVVLVYGGLVWGVLPSNPMVSWQGHLFGAVAGVVTARWLSRRRGRR